MLKKDPLFVIGCPRSGTTLLSKFMNSTCYGAPVETHFITKYYKKLNRYGDIQIKKNFNRLVNDILSERPVMQWNLKLDVEQFWKRLEDVSFRGITNALLMHRFNRLGKISWGDKTPHYIFDLKIIYELFPESKYIFIVRDGRDVALSLLQKPWGPNNIYACARYWASCNEENKILETLREKKQIFETTYETILHSPEDILRQIYEFLGEYYDDDLMEKEISSINTNNYNKWKTEMPEKQIRLFERVAGNTLLRFGYEASFVEEGPIKPMEQSVWRIHDAAIQFGRLVKMNTIDTVRIKYLGREPFAD